MLDKTIIITNAKYVEAIPSGIKHIITTIDSITMSVPLDPANRHYAEILKQVADGTITIAEAD